MPKIEELFAWVMADKDESDEGVPAMEARVAGRLMAAPLIGADMKRARSLRSQAQAVANLMGKPIKLIRSTGIEVLEVLQPEVEQ